MKVCQPCLHVTSAAAANEPVARRRSLSDGAGIASYSLMQPAESELANLTSHHDPGASDFEDVEMKDDLVDAAAAGGGGGATPSSSAAASTPRRGPGNGSSYTSFADEIAADRRMRSESGPGLYS